MLNTRKAMIGWLVYTAAKPIVKRALKSRAKAAIPGKGDGSGRKIPPVLGLAGAAGLVGALLLWRSRRSNGEDRFDS